MIKVEEKNELIEFVNKYKEIYKNINDLEEKLASIMKSKDALLMDLKETRRKETIYVLELQEKYGKEKITPDILKDLLT